MTVMSKNSRPISGVGIGLRSPHINKIITTQPKLPWVELLADNHLAEGGLVYAQLDAITELYPVTLHCVGMSLASTSPLDKSYCQKIKVLAERVDAAWVSEHLCFTSANGIHSHDLLPIPYNQESLSHCANRILQIQDFLGERLLIENVSNYMTFKQSDRSEIDFIVELAEKSDCWLLVDVNNIYVNHINHGLNAQEYIKRLPLERIKEIHLAGYQQQENYLLDAHNNPVSEPVWDLYQQLLQRKADIPTLIEWDNDIPSLEVLINEAHKAEKIRQQIR